MANLWNGFNACGWHGRTGKENEKTRIFQGCQRDILVTLRCCFNLVIAKRFHLQTQKLVEDWFGGPTPLQSDT